MGSLKSRHDTVHSTIDALYEAIEILEDPVNEHLYSTCNPEV